MVRKIANVIKDILNVQKSVPIGIKWKEVTGSIRSESCETVKVKNALHMEGTKDNREEKNEKEEILS
jgi:hypothetical protein